MSDEDFELLLAMAEEAENAHVPVDLPCSEGEKNCPEDMRTAVTAAGHEASDERNAEEDEDFNLLLEMAAQAEAAGESDQNILPAKECSEKGEQGTSVALIKPPGSPGTKRKASDSPPPVKRARSTADAEQRPSVKPNAGSKPEQRKMQAAFQPVSGKHGRRNKSSAMPQPGKPIFTEKLVEKHSGLRMKNPVFPTIIFGERVSHLQFLRLPRIRERANAADDAGPWATVGVLVEKSKPCPSKTGSMYSRWKLSDLGGAEVTMLLFGSAHDEHFRESEGSVVAIFNAAAENEKGLTLKVNEASAILKLATSSDFAYCGSRRKNGTRCRNPVNISVCRFCDYHVQSESKRITTNRGVLQDSSHAARLNTQAVQAAQRQRVPHFAPYVPKQMTEQELAVQSVTYSSQGAKHIIALNKALAQENSPQTPAARRPGSAQKSGRDGQEESRELLQYRPAQLAPARPRPQLQAAATAAGVDPARPARPTLPQPPRPPCPAATAPARPSLTGAEWTAPGAAQPSAPGRPAGAARGTGTGRPMPDSGSGAAAGARKLEAEQMPRGRPNSRGVQGSSGGAARVQAAATASGSGAGCGAGRGETGFVLLEEAEIEWDAADVAALKRHKPAGSGAQHVDRDSSPEPDRGGGRFSRGGQSGVIRPEPASCTTGSLYSAPAAACRHSSGPHPAQTAEERARNEAMRRAVELVKSHGGVEAAAEAAKKDKQAAAARKRDQQPAHESEAAQPEPSNGTAAAPSSSGAGPAAKPAERPPQSFYGAAAARSAAQRGSAAAAGTQLPKAGAAKPSGTRATLEVKLGLRSKSSIKASASSSAARAKPLVVPPGTSAFAAAFGDALTEEDMRNVGTRYKQTVDDEEADKLDRLLGSMQKKDELQQRGEAITQLSVSAWHCTTCDTITERRRPHCQEHGGKRVNATKRWWTCSGCNNRFTTVGVKYPTKRCPNPRCTAPNSEFKKASMGRAPKSTAGSEASIAAREHFLPRGIEHGFALRS